MPPRVLHYSDLENVFDTPERTGRVASVLADRDGPETLVAGSGDNTSPGVLSLACEGRQALDFFEAVDPDVETVGNHDLDHGTDALRSLVADAPQAWTLANAFLDGDRFGREVGIEPTTTLETAGSRVGFVGVLDPATREMTPQASHLTFTDPVATVAEHATDLRDDGADYVLALAHLGDGDARAVAAEADVDAVLAGHSHDHVETTVEGTPLVRTGATGTRVFELDLATGAVTCHETAGVEPDESVVEALQRRVAETGLDDVVAHVEDPISREREDRPDGEWRLGNFVANAYRWKTGADVGVQNAGGIREGPTLSGDVTVADLISCSPFDEPVVVAEVTGAELFAVAHEADGRLVGDLGDRWWGHVSGMQIDSLAGAPDAESEVVANGGTPVAPLDHLAGVDGSPRYSVTVAGEPVEFEETYTVAVPEYLLVTDREFPSLTECQRVEQYDPQYEVIVDYARENGVDPSLDGRIPDVTSDSQADSETARGHGGSES